jgi:hypothetical protein
MLINLMFALTLSLSQRKLRPSELWRLLNSTPLGEVVNEPQLRRLLTWPG